MAGASVIGRHIVCEEIASGGMATVHLGRVVGQGGFARTVAIKRLHPQYGKDPEFVAMFLDEARLAARVHHPNVVDTLDVVSENGELLLIMEYVQGETLARLQRLATLHGPAPSPAIVSAITAGALYGLHAAHEASTEDGTPLNIVHRDVSPQNILVGADGLPRVLDFGVAKAAMRSQSTTQGQLKGKLGYMSPEQLLAQPLDRRADLFAAGVMLWEGLTGRRLFHSDDVGAVVAAILNAVIQPPSRHNPSVPAALDAVVLKALERDVGRRFRTAREFAAALERALPLARQHEIGEWVGEVATESLAKRARLVAAIELSSVQARSTSGGLPTNADADVTIPGVHHVSANGSEQPPSEHPTLSQTSSLSVVTDTQPRSKRRVWPALALLMALSVPLLVWFFMRTAQTAATPQTAAAQQTAAPPRTVVRAAAPDPSAPMASPAAPPAFPAATAELVPSPAPTLAAAAPISAAAAANGQATTVGSRRTPTRSVRRPTAGAAARPNCNPPYRIDERGVRRARPECL